MNQDNVKVLNFTIERREEQHDDQSINNDHISGDDSSYTSSVNYLINQQPWIPMLLRIIYSLLYLIEIYFQSVQ